MAKLIVALGNPGVQYELTRHNIGWLVMDQLEDRLGLRFKEKFKGLYADHSIDGEKVYFLKPQTFMNLSGESVAPLCKFFKVEVEDILVLQDELDLPYGTMVFKNAGGLAGHNGLKSITAQMGSQKFLRLRLGIGRPVHGSVSSYVLSRFSDEEDITFEKYLLAACDAVEHFIKTDFEKAARKFPKKSYID